MTAILANLLSGGLFDFAGKVLDKIFPDPAARAQAQMELVKLQQTGELAHLAAETDLAKGQMAINQVEAASSSLFVSGWRPFCGWVCGFGLAYATILQPFALFVAKLSGSVMAPPEIDTMLLITVLTGMLGLGVQRTYEKQKGITAVEPGH